MAGDWIKMEKSLGDKPEVRRLARALGVSRYDVIGRLHAVWAWADTHSLSGSGMDISEEDIDDIADINGFAEVLRQVGWLKGRAAALEFPNFDRHNGQTAKSRAMDSRKKCLQRKSTQRDKMQCVIGTEQGRGRDICPGSTGTTQGLEKRREEIDRIGDKAREEVNQFPADSSEVERFIAAQTVRPPTVESVSDCAAAFFDAFEARGWRDSKGVLLHNWRPAARSYARTWARNATQSNTTTNHKPKKKDDYNLF